MTSEPTKTTKHVAEVHNGGTMSGGVVPPAPFNPAQEDWESYMDHFQMFLEINNLNDATPGKKWAVFLTHCGPTVFKMAKALVKLAKAKAMDRDVLEPLLRAHYAPTVPTLVRRHEFYQRNQRKGESVANFISDLRNLGGLCDFTDLEEALRDRVVLGLDDLNVQSKIMAKGDVTLKDAIAEATAAEATKKSAVQLCRNRAPAHPPAGEVSPNAEGQLPTAYHEDLSSSSDSDEEEVHCLRSDRERYPQPCAGCGANHYCSDCKFRHALCHKCGKRGHIGQVCRSLLGPSQTSKGTNLHQSTGNRPIRREPVNHSYRNRPVNRLARREEAHQTLTIGHASS